MDRIVGSCPPTRLPLCTNTILYILHILFVPIDSCFPILVTTSARVATTVPTPL